MYNYITQDLDKTFASKKILFWNVKVTVRQAIENIAGKHTVALLEAAQVGKGKPAGASKEYKSLAETGCENFIRQNLENTVKKIKETVKYQWNLAKKRKDLPMQLRMERDYKGVKVLKSIIR